MILAITLRTHMCFFRSHQISHDSQRCARVVFRLKRPNRQLFSARLGKLVQSTQEGASNFFANYVHCSFFRRFSIMQTFLFPSILTSSYFCVLIELPEACFLEMKTESLLFTESWTFVANALISAKNVSLQKYPSLLSLFAYRLKCRRKSTSH